MGTKADYAFDAVNVDTLASVLALTNTTPGGTLPTGVGGNRYLIITLNSGNPKYGGQIAFGFGGEKIAIRGKYNSETWTNWKYLTAS